MAHGFEIYNDTGDLMFSTDSVAYFNVDVFEITYPNNGQITYSDLPAGMVLEADWVAYEFDFGFVIDQMIVRDGFPVLNVSGNTVDWTWSAPEGNGYNSTRAIVRVFAR